MECIIIYERELQSIGYILKVYKPRNSIHLARFFDEVLLRGADYFINWFIAKENEEWENEILFCGIVGDIVEFQPNYIKSLDEMYQTGNFFQL